MTTRCSAAILGTTLVMAVGVMSVAYAQEQVKPPATSDATDAEEKATSETVTASHANAVTKNAEGKPTGLAGRFVNDQREIWTSPAKLRFWDTAWLVPLGGVTAGLYVTDRDFSKHLSQNPTTISHYKTLSNAGLGALIGGAGGVWLLGHASHNEHWSETGFLAGEATLNSLVAVETFKYSFRRERPFQGNGSGSFFQGGGTSFPSEHAAAAWSVASVVAHEYPGPLTKIMAYGLASLVDISRVKARQHFPSDVVVGSVIGNLVAQNIYSRHHDFNLGGAEWRSISQIFRGDSEHSTANQGSPYVPLDNWIYPALDRLAAMGLIDGGFAGMRPWTRSECARLLSEAEDKVGESGEARPEVQKLLSTLEREFHSESEAAGGGDAAASFRLESVYSRTEHISGMPLTDGFHFAQTQFNDFGRPYGEGWSSVTGFSVYTTAGRWVGYVRGELQTAPNVPARPLSARQFIQQIDGLPLPPATVTPSIGRFQLLDAYVGLMASNWQVSFGQQSLYWGSGVGGSLEISNNIQPINMFRVSRTSPLKLPNILRWLGPMRTEFFLGQLAGYEFIFSPLGLIGQWGRALPDQPYIHGQNISFKPTPNFEFGFYRTTIFGGEGYPFTTHALVASLFDLGNAPAGAASKPGKRTSGLDFSYRLPRLRDWVTFYGDGLAYDQFSPIAYADRSEWHAGLFFTQFPKLHKVDLRVEGVYSDNPLGGLLCCGVFYANATWRSGYTNAGNIIGSWIGRAGQGAQAWTNYWFSTRNRLQFNFRHQKVSQEYLPGGGTLTDAGAQGDYLLRSNLSLSVCVHYERWLFPLLQANPVRNVAVSLGIDFGPQKLLRPFHAVAADAPGMNGDQP